MQARKAATKFLMIDSLELLLTHCSVAPMVVALLRQPSTSLTSFGS